MADVLFALFCVLQLADAHLTLLIMRRGGSEEWPPMRLLIRTVERLLGLVDAQRQGPAVALIGLKTGYCLLLWHYLPTLPLWLLVGLCAVYAPVVVSNWQEATGRRSLLDRLREVWGNP